MLASITPLGERSRGFSWGLTASAFAVGAVAAGAAGGAIGGALGSLAPSGGWRTAAGLAVLAAAVCFDGTRLGRRLPTSRRQVNEDWLGRYRGWVYGVAFGAQLGAGLATVVTSAAVYAAALGAVLCGTVAGGAAVGAAFGLTRALSLLPARMARDGAGLMRLHAALGRLERPARRLVVAGEILGLALLIGGLT
jgi:MFS family permease